MFWITFLSLTFAPTTFLFCRLFPSLYFRLLKLFSSGWEILFWFRRWIWLLNACVLFDQSHDFSLIVLQFLVTAVLGIVFISRPSLFHFASRILVIFIASWMIFLEIGFFIISFLTRWYFVFKEMALSWELIFFLNFVGSEYWCDMIEGLQCASVCRVVNAWCRFCFLCIFFKITALDSV